jgi:hypothetical protein
MDSYSFDEQSGFRVAQQTRRAEQSPRSRTNLRDPTRSFGTNDWWPCKSQASSDCPAFGIAAVVDITTIAGEDRPIILVDQPSTTFRRQYVVINQDGVKGGDIGACTFGPRVRVAYDSSATPSFDDGWGPKAGQWTITKNYPSAISIVGVSDSSAKNAFGVLSPINIVIGKLAGDLAPNDHATVNIYGGAGGSEAIISSLTIDSREWVGASLKSGAAVRCEWINGLWYIETAETAGSIWGTLAATISGDPTSCNVSKYINCKNPGSTVNVYQPSSTFFTGNSGARYRATYNVDDAKWYFDWVDECH